MDGSVTRVTQALSSIHKVSKPSHGATHLGSWGPFPFRSLPQSRHTHTHKERCARLVAQTLFSFLFLSLALLFLRVVVVALELSRQGLALLENGLVGLLGLFKVGTDALEGNQRIGIGTNHSRCGWLEGQPSLNIMGVTAQKCRGRW